MGEVAVQVRTGTKWSGETTALDGVDFTPRAGQVHGLALQDFANPARLN